MTRTAPEQSVESILERLMSNDAVRELLRAAANYIDALGRDKARCKE